MEIKESELMDGTQGRKLGIKSFYPPMDFGRYGNLKEAKNEGCDEPPDL